MDIFIADSGRPIRSTCVVTYVTPIGSGSMQQRVDGINTFAKPSGYDGNVSVSRYAQRFDDTGYYETAHSGYLYGVPRDGRQYTR